VVPLRRLEFWRLPTGRSVSDRHGEAREAAKLDRLTGTHQVRALARSWMILRSDQARHQGFAGSAFTGTAAAVTGLSMLPVEASSSPG